MDVGRKVRKLPRMSEEEQAKLEKGARVAIVSGRRGVGMRGEIFWIGENKYGPGVRYGVRGDDAETYWVDEADLGPEAAVPEPPPPEEKPVLDKGQRVVITKGRSKGVEGEVFWVGESKFGPGMRYGVKGDDDETHWADEQQLEPTDSPPPSPAEGASEPSRSGPPPLDDAPMPDPDQAPMPDPDAAPADPFDDDVPFPGDDLPF